MGRQGFLLNLGEVEVVCIAVRNSALDYLRLLSLFPLGRASTSLN